VGPPPPHPTTDNVSGLGLDLRLFFDGFFWKFVFKDELAEQLLDKGSFKTLGEQLAFHDWILFPDTG
jgi:hypothetical protein